jgi:hypothetical protein
VLTNGTSSEGELNPVKKYVILGVLLILNLKFRGERKFGFVG